jgi:hypothetical protein
MPERKGNESLPGRHTHGDNGKEPATHPRKPAASPTAQRHDTETAHHSQQEKAAPKPQD